MSQTASQFYNSIITFTAVNYKPIVALTLSLPRVPYIKIQDECQISICKILEYKWYHVKILLTRFHLNGHTIGFHL